MKRLSLISLLLFLSISLFAQKKSLDQSIYDGWRTIKSFLISDDANLSLTEYSSYLEKSVLEIKINSSGFSKTVVGASSAKLFFNEQLALFTTKDTLYLMDIASEQIKIIPGATKPSAYNLSKFITYYKNKKLYVLDVESLMKGKMMVDSVLKTVKSSFLSSANLMLLCSDFAGSSFISINLDSKDVFKRDTIYKSDKFIKDFDFTGDGNRIIFFSSIDSTGFDGIEVELLEKNSKNKKVGKGLYSHTVTKLNETLIPENMSFNLKKGIAFSEDGSYYKFELLPKEDDNELETEAIKGPRRRQKLKAIATRDASSFEYELWRWNDTLLPSQKRGRNSVYSNTINCIYRPSENKFIKLSHGHGIFLMLNDNSLYGFELDSKPYLYEDLWKDPIPKDFYYNNVKTGESKVLFKKFDGVFAVSATTPHLFTYENSTESWYVNYLESGRRINLSELIPYPTTRDDFDKPQPAGTYGQAGLSADTRFFIVYDKYDVWAVPINGNAKEVYCITNEYGRKNNIRFKVLNFDKGKGNSGAVDLKQDILLEATNLENMHSGFYRVSKGKDLQKLIEGPYKFSWLKPLKDGSFILKRESFSEAPDYWLADKNLKLIRRITSLNEQLQEYKTGNSKVISWNDGSGQKQRGVLYTPEGYDSTKAYPTIVNFYETMSQNAFLFYDPAPTTSTINPVMYVTKGYVMFMPDIRYEIGWPGKSCLNIVESGVRYLIDRGIANPKKIGLQGHSWGGYQVAYLITQTDIFTCACSETAVANMTSAYTGLRSGPGKPRMFMYESTQSRIGGTLWDKKQNYIENSPLFYLDQVTTPLLSRHSDGDEAVPYSQGLELFLGLKRLGKEVWMFNYKGDGHNIKKREIALDWTRRMDEYFDYYLLGAPKPVWMILE